MEAAGTALVTGAGRGIGRAVAVELACRGFDVLATMRDPAAGDGLVDEVAERADEVAERAGGPAGSIEVRRLDLGAVEEAALPPTLRVLVNNAGVDCENWSVEDTPLAEWRRVFETNVFGTVALTSRALPALRAAGAAGGAVVCNVTSVSVVVPMPFFAVYRASKAAVSAMGESLRGEVAPFGVRVLEVVPGPVDTDMLAASATEPEAVGSPTYAPLARRVGAVRAALTDAEPVPAAAGRIVDAIVDDDAPLRVACDPVGAALLESWRTSTDEVHAAGFLDAFRLA